MGKEVRTLLIFALAIFLLHGVYATDTTIQIKTVPYANVNINILDPNVEGFSSIDKLNADADMYGDLTLVYADSEERFDLSVYVKKNEDKVFYEKYTGFTAGEDIYIEAVKPGTTLFYAPNETEEETETSVNETQTNDTVTGEEVTNDTSASDTPGITGAVTSENDSGGLFSNSILYFVLGFLVLGAVIFTGALKYKTLTKKAPAEEETPQKEIKVKKLSEKLKEMKETKKGEMSDYQKAIAEAEEKIKKAQEEINRLKNVERVKELKKRMEDDKKELEKLTGEPKD